MKNPLLLLTAMLLTASTAAASNMVQNDGHKHVLKTNLSSRCGTPAAKTRKECTGGAQSLSHTHTKPF